MVCAWRFFSQRAGVNSLSIIIVGTKIGPPRAQGACRGVLPLQALQQGAGERIPIAGSKLWH